MIKKPQQLKILAAKGGYSQEQAEIVYDAFVNMILSVVSSGNSLMIPKLGKFDVVRVAERSGYDPHRKRPMKIKPRLALRYTPAAEAKRALGIAQLVDEAKERGGDKE